MGQLADKINQAFSSREARVISVPEWGATFSVFPLTLLQISEIDSEKDQYRRLVRILRCRAKKPDGTAFFDGPDIEALLERGFGDYGVAVVARVAGEIMADLATPEGVEKN